MPTAIIFNLDNEIDEWDKFHIPKKTLYRILFYSQDILFIGFVNLTIS